MLFLFTFCISGIALAQPPADENFDDNPFFDITSNDFTLDGIRYQVSGNGTTYRQATFNATFNLSEGGPNDYALQFNKNSLGQISSITISLSDGSAFQIASLSMDILSDTPVQFSSDNGGNFSLNANNGVNVLYQNFDFTGQTGFDNITYLTISGTNMYIDIDDLNLEPAVAAASIPSIITNAAAGIGSTQATLNSDVSSDGGATVTERGFVYSTTDNTPTLGETGVTQVVDGSGTGTFSEVVSGLNSSTNYYYQAYATNSEGTAYGGIESFTTSVPNLQNFYWSADNLNAGAIGVTYTFSYTTVTEVGPSYEMVFYPISSSYYGSGWDVSGLTINDVSVTINGLPATVSPDSYFTSTGSGAVIRITSAVSAGSDVEVTFSNVKNNATPGTYSWFYMRTAKAGGAAIDVAENPDPIILIAASPTVTTSAASSITTTGATFHGNVTSDGGATVTERGFVYSSSDNTPTIGETGVSRVTSGSGTGIFSEAITGLNSSITYYYQAYATNSKGTTYGELESFTTADAPCTGTITIGTTASGAAYSIDGGVLTAIGNATVPVSAITNYLQNTGDLVIETCQGDILIDVTVLPDLANVRTLKFKASGNIILNPGSEISATGNNLNLVFWSDTDGNEDGVVWLNWNTTLQGTGINTNGGHLWMGGGSGTMTWNGLIVGDGVARGNAINSNGITLIKSNIQTNGGNLAIYGRGRTGATVGIPIPANETGSSAGTGNNVNGIRILGGTQINSGEGTIYMYGFADAPSGNANGIELSQPPGGHGLITNSNTTEEAILLEGYAENNPTADNSWGVYTHYSTVQNTSSGTIHLKGGGAKNSGVTIAGAGAVLSESGKIILEGTSSGGTNPEVLIQGALGQKTSSAISASSADIEIIGDKLSISGTDPNGIIASTGKLSIKPLTAGTTIGIGSASGILQLPANYFTSNFSENLNEIIIGSPSTGDITIGSLAGLYNSLAFISGQKIIQTGNLSYANGLGSQNTINELSLQTTDEIRLGGSITGVSNSTTGRGVIMSFDAPSIILTNTIAHASAAQNITYKGSINGDGVTPRGLTVDPWRKEGSSFFEGPIGDLVPLNTFYVKSGGNSLFSGAAINTTGNVTLGMNGLRIDKNTVFNTDGGNFLLGTGWGGLNDASSIGGNFNLTINTVNAAETSAGLVHLGRFNNFGGHYINNLTVIAKGNNGAINNLRLGSSGGIYADLFLVGNLIFNGGDVELRYSTFANSGRLLRLRTNFASGKAGDVNFGDSQMIGYRMGTSGGFNLMSGVEINTSKIGGTAGDITLGKIRGAGSGIPGEFDEAGRAILNAAGTTPGTIRLNGDVLTRQLEGTFFNASIEVSGNLDLVKNTILDNSNSLGTSANIILKNGQVNGDFDLEIKSANGITYSSKTGNIIPLKNLTLSSKGILLNQGVSLTEKSLMETSEGNITLAADVSTLSNDPNAIVFNAGKSEAIGTKTGGDIIVSGTPTMTTGATGIVKLFSGAESTSTGLTSLAGGTTNIRKEVDETTINFDPILEAGNAYALYRYQDIIQLTIDSQNLTTSKTYDGTNSAGITDIVLAGVQSGDEVSVTAEASYDNVNTGAGKTITVVYILGGADADAYLAPENTVVTTGEILTKELTISGLLGEDKVYDGNISATVSGTPTLNGVETGDDVALGGTPSFTFADSNAGTGVSITALNYTIDGTDAGNYTLTQPTGLSADIIRRTLGITAESNSKVYDGTVLTDNGYSITSGALLSGHMMSAMTVTGSQTNAGTSTNIPSTAVILDGSNMDVTANYNINYLNGTLEVTPADLTITAESKSRIYGEANPALTFIYDGLVNGDTKVSTEPTINTTAKVGSNAGIYP
ncbi:YDG domain-containing protein [Salegentibacter sp. F14]